MLGSYRTACERRKKWKVQLRRLKFKRCNELHGEDVDAFKSSTKKVEWDGKEEMAIYDEDEYDSEIVYEAGMFDDSESEVFSDEDDFGDCLLPLAMGFAHDMLFPVFLA